MFDVNYAPRTELPRLASWSLPMFPNFTTSGGEQQNPHSISILETCGGIFTQDEYSSTCQIAAYAPLWRKAADSIPPCFENTLETEGELRIRTSNMDLSCADSIQDDDHSGEEQQSQPFFYSAANVLEAHTISQRIRSLKKIPPELLPLGVVIGCVCTSLTYRLC